MRYEQSETLYRAYTYIHMYTNRDTRTHRDIVAYERQRQNQKGKKRDRQTGDICSLRVNLNLSFFFLFFYVCAMVSRSVFERRN